MENDHSNTSTFKGRIQIFLTPNLTWNRFKTSNPTRGFEDDPSTLAAPRTAAEKADTLSMMLGLISTFVPHFLSNDIVRNSTSMDYVWQAIRKYYGFKQSEINMLNYYDIKWEDGERPERLFQRLMAHIQDNLLTIEGKLQHNGAPVTEDEDFTPMVQRLVTLRWMHLLHPGLYQLVKRTFSSDMLQKSVYDLQPQIANALTGLLDELRSHENVSTVSYVQQNSNKPSWRNNDTSSSSWQSHSQQAQRQRNSDRGKKTKFSNSNRQFPMSLEKCRVCQAEGRNPNHSLAKCDFMCRAEKRQFFKTYRVDVESDEDITPDNQDEVGSD